MATMSPAIQFTVDLSLLRTEQVGSTMNPTYPAAVNGDVFPDDPTQAAACDAYRPQTRVTWLPGMNGAGGREVKHGDVFTAYGPEAVYLMRTYGIGQTGYDGQAVPADRQFLQVSIL